MPKAGPSNGDSRMKSGGVLKHFILAFAIALGLYAVAYYSIEHQRNRKGPWRVSFTHDPAGQPALQINQPTLGITNVSIVFAGESVMPTNASDTIVFDQPKQVPYAIPFGRCVFMDTTFLPGTVTLQLFGHELELLPRVMILDHEEKKWLSGEAIVVHH